MTINPNVLTLIIKNSGRKREKYNSFVIREGVWYVKTQLSFILFVMLTTTFLATVGRLQVTKMFIEENCTEYVHSIGAYSKLSKRSLCRLDWNMHLYYDHILYSFPLYIFL